MQHNCYQYCEQMANQHFPKVYKDLIIHVVLVSDAYDMNQNMCQEMYPFPNEDRMEEMLDQIMDRYQKDQNRNREEDGNRQYGGGVVRDLATILLLQRLLGRRNYMYGNPMYGNPIYGNPGFNGYPFPGGYLGY